MPGVKDYFLYNQFREDLKAHKLKSKESIAERFGEFVKTYYAFDKKVLDASELKNCIKTKNPIFGLYTQEDAHEFLLYIINQMSEELNRYFEAYSDYRILK